MPYIHAQQTLPLNGASQITGLHHGDLTDDRLSEIFGVRICSLTHAEYSAMITRAEEEAALNKQQNPEGPVRCAHDIFPARMQERFPQYAHVMTKDFLLGMFFYGGKARASVALTHPDESDPNDRYTAFIIRPEKQQNARQYLSETCYGYNEAMFKGAAEASIDLWHEFSTLHSASSSLTVAANLYQPTLPDKFQTPTWKADALALRAFMNRADEQDYDQRKLIANQYYGVMSLVTVTNTHISAYEAQLLKRLDDPDLEQTGKMIKEARSALVYHGGAAGKVFWGQGCGEAFIIANENSIAPIYYSLKDSLAKGEITAPLEREIAEDFLTGAALLFPHHLLSQSPHMSERLMHKFNNLLPRSTQNEAPKSSPLLRYIHALLPKPK